MGQQKFWGDWHVYSWFLGHVAPQALECAFLALDYWAFKQIESGRSPDEIIQAIVEGNECYAVLGLALVIALETYHVSATTLPIATCQRLWEHDIARVVQEPSRNLDLFGLGHLSRLSGVKAQAKEFLDSRMSRKRDIKQLAMRFALSGDDELRARFKASLALFPDELPYELEEYRTNPRATADLKENADSWAGLGDIVNYRKRELEAGAVEISYEAPKPLTPIQQQRLAQSTTSLNEMAVIGWASKCLEVGKLGDGISLLDAVAFAKKRDNAKIFERRFDVPEHSPQTTVSAVAAVVVCFGHKSGFDHDWAWDVMDRVFGMQEPQDIFSGALIPWHPATHLIIALWYDRRSGSARKDTAQRLFKLTSHPLENVSHLAFRVLFKDIDPHIRWVAGQLAVDLSIYHQAEISSDGRRSNKTDKIARAKSLVHALRRLQKNSVTPFTELPPAWVKTNDRRRASLMGDWHDANPAFDPQYAAKLFPLFPVEEWCQSNVYKPMFEHTLKQLVNWSSERLMPSWDEKKSRHERDYNTANLIEWNHALGDLIARSAPFFDLETVRKEFLSPFLSDGEQGLGVLAEFADKTVSRQVFDAATIPDNTLPLLCDCVDRTVRDSAFSPSRYRGGQVYGFDLPKLVEALLFVQLRDEAPGAARFANGDWSQIPSIIPVVTRLITKIGWSSFVMQKFLTLCERAGASYPLDSFSEQVNSVLGSISNAKGSWSGTLLPARIASMVQSLADANFPLTVSQAQSLLNVLDALIDLGDRRSAALEQTEAFKQIQGTPNRSS